jgi:endonuclease III-like uncharacterized protein
MEILTNVFSDILIAVITALLTMYVSFRKFSSQKWWERKEETYANIIGTLSSLLGRLEKWKQHSLKNKELKKEDILSLYKKFDKEREEIELIAREGAFRITPKSSRALQTVIDSFSINAEHDDVEGLEVMSKKVSNCLETLTAEAKNDLKIDTKWSFFW